MVLVRLPDVSGAVAQMGDLTMSRIQAVRARNAAIFEAELQQRDDAQLRTLSPARAAIHARLKDYCEASHRRITAVDKVRERATQITGRDEPRRACRKRQQGARDAQRDDRTRDARTTLGLIIAVSLALWAPGDEIPMELDAIASRATGSHLQRTEEIVAMAMVFVAYGRKCESSSTLTEPQSLIIDPFQSRG